MIRLREGIQAVDLGCGTGELTRRLADRLPGCDMLGLDSFMQTYRERLRDHMPGNPVFYSLRRVIFTAAKT